MHKAAEILRDNLQQRMAAQGLSQDACARRAGVSQSAIGYILRYQGNGDKQPTIDTVQRVARAFGVQAWQLLAPTDAQPAPDPLDTKLLVSVITTAASAFRARGALPDDAQLAGIATFLYRRVKEGVGLKRAVALVDAELAKIGKNLASEFQGDTGVRPNGRFGKDATGHRGKGAA